MNINYYACWKYGFIPQKRRKIMVTLWKIAKTYKPLCNFSHLKSAELDLNPHFWCTYSIYYC